MTPVIHNGIILIHSDETRAAYAEFCKLGWNFVFRSQSEKSAAVLSAVELAAKYDGRIVYQEWSGRLFVDYSVRHDLQFGGWNTTGKPIWIPHTMEAALSEPEMLELFLAKHYSGFMKLAPGDQIRAQQYIRDLMERRAKTQIRRRAGEVVTGEPIIWVDDSGCPRQMELLDGSKLTMLNFCEGPTLAGFRI